MSNRRPDVNPTSPRIAGAGVCCMDYIVTAPQIVWGDTGHVSDFLIQGGGLVATALVACARLGAECALFSLLGDDSVGQQILEELNSEGVSTEGVLRSAGGESPFSFVHTDVESGERTIFYRPGRGLSRTLLECDLIFISECDALLVDDVYPELALAAATVARAHSIPVVGDMTPGPANEELLRYVDVLIAPRHFARSLGCEDHLDRALDAIHDLGPRTALITLGSDGWVYSDPTGRGRGSAFQVDVVDTTGAGDVFHGAFAYALARGWDTHRCAEFAAAVAALKCTQRGGRTGLPSLSQTVDFLRKRNTLSEWL
jgi:sulfofructose kinase